MSSFKDLPDELLVEQLLLHPIELILQFCKADRRFAGICQKDYLWRRLLRRDFPCVNVMGLPNPREVYFEAQATPKRIQEFPWYWDVSLNLQQNLEIFDEAYYGEHYDLLGQPLYGLCTLVLYYPVGSEFYRVVYNFNQPPTRMQILHLITAFYQQPYTPAFAAAIGQPYVPLGPQASVHQLLGDDHLIGGISQHRDGYILHVEH